MKSKITAAQAKAAGYCITSRRSPTWATRIDRKDWKQFMAAQHPGGKEWVSALGKDAADQYRRCYSKDTIIVPSSWVKLLPNSSNGPNVFLQETNMQTEAERKKKEEEERRRRQQAEQSDPGNPFFSVSPLNPVFQSSSSYGSDCDSGSSSSSCGSGD